MVSRSECSSSNPCSKFGSTDNGCLQNLKKGEVGSSKYELASEAADALEIMYEDMPEDVQKDLKISDSYRPLKIQCNIFNFDTYEETGKRIKIGTSNVAVAAPGTSNHGWGRALDLSSRKAQQWIKDNGYKYGWCWGEVTSEPWHFTYCGPGPNRSSRCDSFCKGKMEISSTDTSIDDEEEEGSIEKETTTDKKTKSNQSSSALGPIGDFLNFLGIVGEMKESIEENENLNEELNRIHDIFKKIL
jgi:hypothetical protein